MHIHLFLTKTDIHSDCAREFFSALQREGITYSVSAEIASQPFPADTLFIVDSVHAYKQLVPDSPCIGYECDEPLPCPEITTNLWDLSPEYLEERFCFLCRLPYCYYCGEYRYRSLSFADYRKLFALQRLEPHMLPDELKQFDDNMLYQRYHNRFVMFHFDDCLGYYGIYSANDDKLIGTVALSPVSFTSPYPYEIEYYVVPSARQNGHATRFLREFLSTPRLSGTAPVIARIHADNRISRHVVERLNASLLSFETNRNEICFLLRNEV